MGEKEDRLIVKAQAGDRRSFDALVAATYQLVYNTAYRVLGEPEAAADATQTAFVRAYRSLHNFRRSSSFSTWMYRIVTNVCIDKLRLREREPHDSLTVEDENERQGQRDLPDERSRPDTLTEKRELQEAVHQALSRLKPEQRLIIVLYDLNGFSYENISEMLNVPLGTIKSRLNRARKALREEMRSYRELME